MRWRRAWLMMLLGTAGVVGTVSPSRAGDDGPVDTPTKGESPPLTTEQTGRPVAAATAKQRVKLAPPAKKQPEAAKAVELDWKPLWALDVTRGASWSSGPIAVRGRLLVVPSFGLRVGEVDDFDGALVVDGKTGELVRRVTVPGGDATGVALDGDHVVVSARAGHVVKARLDGLETWSASVGGGTWGPATLADLNADRTLDALVVASPCASGAACDPVLVALDGGSGSELWRRPIEKSNPPNSKPVVAVKSAQNGAPDLLLHRAPGAVVRLEPKANGNATGLPVLPQGLLPVSPEELAEWFAADGRKLPIGRFELAKAEWTLGSLDSTVWFEDPDETTISLARRTSPGEAPVLAVSSSDLQAPVRLRALTSVSSPLSLGDVNDDGIWDVVFIADGKLQALPTGYGGDVMLALPRGDLLNSGILPARLENIDSYRTKLPARDASWWLARQPKSVSADFRAISSKPTPGLAVAAPNGSLIPIPSSVLDNARRAQRRTIVVTEAGATVCFGRASCAEVASERPLAHVTVETIEERAWALAEDGTLLVHRRGTGRWDVVEGKDSELDPASVERLLAVPGAVAILAPTRTTLFTLEEGAETRVHAAAFRASDVVHCGERWFANNEGRLVAAFATDLGRWAMVPEHPGPVRRLFCDGRDLELETAMNQRFLLAAPPPARDWAALFWLPVALFLVAAGLATVRLGPKQRETFDKSGDVRRRFRIDVPIRSKEQAAGAQGRLAEGLIDFIDNPDTQPPLTIAVCGSWGSGKSSVMNVINSELKSTGRHILVWFNAWRFHREEDIAKAFYQTILDEFRRQAGFINRVRVTWMRVRRAGWSGGFRFVAATSAILAGIGLFVVITQQAIKANAPKSFASAWPVVVGIVATIAGAWTRVLSPALKVVNVDPNKMLGEITGRLRFVQDLKAEFETVFSGLKDTMKLVIFVDDLDRCPPERVTDMLEALNVLADTGHCVLVLAMEKKAVERAVEVRFKDLIDRMEEQGDDSARFYGSRYLEKMVTVAVNVPGLQAASVISAGHGSKLSKVASAEEPRPWYRPEAATVRRRFIDFGAALGAAVALFFVAQSAWRTLPEGFAKDPGKQVYAWFCEAGAFLAGLDATLEGKTPPEADKQAKPSNAPLALASASAATAREPGEKPPVSVAKETQKERTESKLDATAPEPAGSTGVPRFDIPVQAAAAGDPPRDAAPPLGTASPDPLLDERQRISRRESAIRAVVLLALVAVLTGFLAFRARLREIRMARPMAHDSEAFSSALERCAEKLPPNPRNAIRFANLARFLYYLVRKAEPAGAQRDTATSGEHASIELLFCESLVAYWLTGTARYDGMPPWLQKELGAWLGATEMPGQPKTAAAE
jgi:hypothetical protein